MKNGVPAFAAILVAFALPIASASAMERKVPARAIDWSNPAEVSAIYTKLLRASETVCASSGAPRREIMRCMDLTLSAAIEESGRAQLRALHRSRAANTAQGTTS